ncbi:hypothetical protein [Kribbella sp. NPDC051620]|uniref:hypothetical protein n=1 Tax=Kribbella sp. NPDC051620 TaxID=3364120 RepID=UPI0037BC61C1
MLKAWGDRADKPIYFWDQCVHVIGREGRLVEWSHPTELLIRGCVDRQQFVEVPGAIERATRWIRKPDYRTARCNKLGANSHADIMPCEFAGHEYNPPEPLAGQ